jgi:hypothetical protein
MIKDREALLDVYDFPAKHWKHLCQRNRRPFATIRHRTLRAMISSSLDARQPLAESRPRCKVRRDVQSSARPRVVLWWRGVFRLQITLIDLVLAKHIVQVVYSAAWEECRNSLMVSAGVEPQL